MCETQVYTELAEYAEEVIQLNEVSLTVEN
jgi:hypothetical protein